MALAVLVPQGQQVAVAVAVALVVVRGWRAKGLGPPLETQKAAHMAAVVVVDVQTLIPVAVEQSASFIPATLAHSRQPILEIFKQER
jgi:hypothetical protein